MILSGICFKRLPLLLNCFSRVPLFETLWTVVYQTSLSMEFSRQEYWSGLPCPPPGDLPNPGIKLLSLCLSCLICTPFPKYPSFLNILPLFMLNDPNFIYLSIFTESPTHLSKFCLNSIL